MNSEQPTIHLIRMDSRVTAPLVELPPAPRHLCRRPGVGIGPAVGRWVIRIFIFPHCVIGAVLILAALYIPVLLTFGEDVPGAITKLDSSSSRKGKSHHVYYLYTVDGINYTGNDTVGADEYATTKVGQPCIVRVIPALPKIQPQRITSRSPWMEAAKFFLMALVWNGLLSLFVWLAWIAPWRIRRLLKWGVPVAGQIALKRQIKGSKGGMAYQVDYVFMPSADDQPDESANRLTTGKMTISVKDYNAAEQGQVVTVLYDQRKPKRSIVYDFAEYQAVE